MRQHYFDTEIHKVLSIDLPHVPRVNEYVLLPNGQLKLVTRVIYDLQDNVVRIYLDRAPL